MKNLVEAHRGEISVKSEKGKGATFTVILPVFQDEALVEDSDKGVANLAVNDVEGEAPDSVAPEVYAQTQTLPTILIVEDDADMLGFIKSSFEGSYVVYTAMNGREAMKVLRENVVTMIVSDWMMPVMDGAELCRWVRQTPENQPSAFHHAHCQD